jgi:23S rRNA (guanosine2251-2'-O)-methyltransferase
MSSPPRKPGGSSGRNGFGSSDKPGGGRSFSSRPPSRAGDDSHAPRPDRPKQGGYAKSEGRSSRAESGNARPDKPYASRDGDSRPAPASGRPGGLSRPSKRSDASPYTPRAALARDNEQRPARNEAGNGRNDQRPYTPRTGQSRDADTRPPRQTVERAPRPVPDHAARPAPDRAPLSLAVAPQPEQTYRAPLGSARPPRGPQVNLAETPRGTVWLYGIHAVDAALGNPNRRLRRLILTEEAEAALVARHPLPWPLAPERTERPRIDQLLGRDTVHQGAALLADLLAPPLLATMLERPGVVLILDQVTDPRNIGAVLRSAAAFGAAGVITQDRNAPEETGALAKAASGALETVPLLRAVNLARTLVALKAAGFWTVGLDAGGQPLSGPALSERRVALVLGAEGAGIRRLVKETCDEIAGLAMPGTMESLNISAAATVALYEMARKA